MNRPTPKNVIAFPPGGLRKMFRAEATVDYYDREET